MAFHRTFPSVGPTQTGRISQPRVSGVISPAHGVLLTRREAGSVPHLRPEPYIHNLLVEIVGLQPEAPIIPERHGMIEALERQLFEALARKGIRVHPDLWYWPSSSNEQIFYGKKRSPLASKGHQMPYHVKKQYVLQEGAWVVPNGVRGCATISTLFPTAFSLSNSLRMPQL